MNPLHEPRPVQATPNTPEREDAFVQQLIDLDPPPKGPFRTEPYDGPGTPSGEIKEILNAFDGKELDNFSFQIPPCLVIVVVRDVGTCELVRQYGKENLTLQAMAVMTSLFGFSADERAEFKKLHLVGAKGDRIIPVVKPDTDEKKAGFRLVYEDLSPGQVYRFELAKSAV